MEFREKQAAIESHIKTGFEASVARIVFENTPAPNPDLIDEWIRVQVQFGDSFRMQLGDQPAYRHPGVVFIQIFLREGVGVDRGVELADGLTTLLRDQVVGEINLQVPRVNKIPFSDKGWYQLQVATPFYFDEVT